MISTILSGPKHVLIKNLSSNKIIELKLLIVTWVIQDKYISIQRLSTYQAKQKKLADEENQAEQNAPLVRKNFQVHHAKADELVKVLESMKSNRGKISVVERTNSIIVYDTESKIEQMGNALVELDVETLQIMITAKLVVVNSELARELGVDWTAALGTTTLRHYSRQDTYLEDYTQSQNTP